MALSQLIKHYRTGHTPMLPLRRIPYITNKIALAINELGSTATVHKWTLFPRGRMKVCPSSEYVSVPGWVYPVYLLLGVELGFLSSVRRILAHIAATNASFPLE